MLEEEDVIIPALPLEEMTYITLLSGVEVHIIV
jgi:hypothetical protein